MSLARRSLKTVYEELTRLGDELGVLTPDTIYRESWYAQMADDDQLARDAATIVDALYGGFHPKSVIDLGCGVGHYLHEFQSRGVDIHGVEGAKKALPHLQVSRGAVEIADLRESFQSPREFDLAVCFEVAEHLPESAAPTLVSSLTRCADTIAFTAATPGQGGTHHVNEQPRGYWIDLFADHGHHYQPEQTDRLAGQMDVEKATWVPENLFVFQPA